MKLKGTLARLATIVAEEAARNSAFRDRLEEALGIAKVAAGSPSSRSAPKIAEQGRESDGPTMPKRRGGRRSAAVLDPIQLATIGESELRGRLADLDLEQLLDIVAQYGMDPGKLVMKWRDRERVQDRIVEVAMARATKGDAFRNE